MSYVQGGPVIPESFELQELASWTDLDADWQRFSGTARYSHEFGLPEDGADEYLLELGEIRESARIRINGTEVGVLWSLPFSIHIGKYLKEGKNLLEIEVTNLMANRISDMDRRGVDWKKFHDINFVNVDYKPFDASQWEPMVSGLIGPVRIFPLIHQQH